MTEVTIQIACDSPYFASIGDIQLNAKDESVRIELPAGDHELIWAVAGGAGGAFQAKIMEGARTLCSVADWKISVGGGWCGDLAAFQV